MLDFNGKNACMKCSDPRIALLDPSIFSLESQTTELDRVALLRIQMMVRKLHGNYNYLEIGSHLGGSLLPHLLDPACLVVHSVDRRPDAQVDARGNVYEYVGNSTQQMRDLLAATVPCSRLESLVTWDFDAAEIPAYSYRTTFHLVFIDGEHTGIAAFSDFVSVLPTLQRDACIVFHDANLILDAISNAERVLRGNRTRYATFFLRDNVAIICLRGSIDIAVLSLGPHANARDGYEVWARSDLRQTIATEALHIDEL